MNHTFGKYDLLHNFFSGTFKFEDCFRIHSSIGTFDFYNKPWWVEVYMFTELKVFLGHTLKVYFLC